MVKASATVGAEDSTSTETEGVVATAAEDYTATKVKGSIATGTDSTVCSHTIRPYLPCQVDKNLKIQKVGQKFKSLEVGQKLITVDMNFRSWT